MKCNCCVYSSRPIFQWIKAARTKPKVWQEEWLLQRLEFYKLKLEQLGQIRCFFI